MIINLRGCRLERRAASTTRDNSVHPIEETLFSLLKVTITQTV